MTRRWTSFGGIWSPGPASVTCATSPIEQRADVTGTRGGRTDVTLCELTLEGAEIADSGQWTCALTDNNMDTVKHHRELEVRLPGSLGLSFLGARSKWRRGRRRSRR